MIYKLWLGDVLDFLLYSILFFMFHCFVLTILMLMVYFIIMLIGCRDGSEDGFTFTFRFTDATISVPNHGNKACTKILKYFWFHFRNELNLLDVIYPMNWPPHSPPHFDYACLAFV